MGETVTIHWRDMPTPPTYLIKIKKKWWNEGLTSKEGSFHWFMMTARFMFMFIIIYIPLIIMVLWWLNSLSFPCFIGRVSFILWLFLLFFSTLIIILQCYKIKWMRMIRKVTMILMQLLQVNYINFEGNRQLRTQIVSFVNYPFKLTKLQLRMKLHNVNQFTSSVQFFC